MEMNVSFIFIRLGQKNSWCVDRAQMYLLSSQINPSGGQRFYYCDCKGHFHTGSQCVTCFMNYWLYPLST